MPKSKKYHGNAIHALIYVYHRNTIGVQMYNKVSPAYRYIFYMRGLAATNYIAAHNINAYVAEFS